MILRNSSVSWLSCLAFCFACSSQPESGPTSTGGSANTGHTGGASHGGQSATAGSSGSVGSGGTTGATAGGNGFGGNTSGGTVGYAGTGGFSNGGTPGSGRNAGRGGSGGTGGSNAGGTGGRTGSGGTNSGGSGGRGGAGGSAAGGMGNAGATSCSFPSAWNPGDPTYTTYTLPADITACGYQKGASTDTLQNIVNASDFAAIPGNSSMDFNTSSRCGACVQIGTSAIITIVDECPFDGTNNPPCRKNPTGHLDLSGGALNAGNVSSNPDQTGQARWKFVPCPINGNVVVRVKQGNDNEIFIENEILPIASVTCGGNTSTRTFYGAWHFNVMSVKGMSCTVTDAANRSINITVGNTNNANVNTGVQFPKCN